jgi:hypothetical protein
MLAKSLSFSIFSLLTMISFSGSSGPRNPLDRILGSSLSAELRQVFKKLSQGVDCFAGNPAFSFPLQLAKGFPSGRLSGREYRLLLENQVSGGLAVEQAIEGTFLIVEMMRRIKQAEEAYFSFGTATLVQEILVVTVEVLCGKKERIALISTKDLACLVKTLFQSCDARGMDRYLMLIANAGAERGQAGDQEAGRLHASVMDVLARNNKTKGGRRR